MSLYAENREDVNKCWDEFEGIFSDRVFKNLSKKEQKLKAKPRITKNKIISTTFKNFVFKFAINDKKKSSFKNIKAY